jgi:hypothetical protein
MKRSNSHFYHYYRLHNPVWQTLNPEYQNIGPKTALMTKKDFAAAIELRFLLSPHTTTLQRTTGPHQIGIA